VLESDEERLWAVLDRAVALAEAEGAHLTLAKTSDPGRILRRMGPLVKLPAVISSAKPETQGAAADRLARAAEFVPGSVPMTTLMLAADTRSALGELVCSGPYDVVVATAGLLGRYRKLTRELHRRGVCALGVPTACASPQPVGRPPATARSAGPTAGSPR
jgi:hypothetical protein